MKKAKQNNKTLKLLGKISTIVIILLLSLISFVGIYVKDKNTMKNVIPEYKLGTDLHGARNILVKVDDSTTTKKYDSDGNLVKDSSDGDEKNENITEVEEKVNPDELRTADNYEAVKNIIEARLKYMKVEDYLLRFDESTGDISLEVSENSNTDYIAQYTITKGEFKIVDNDTSEVLLTNADLKEAKVQYSTSTSGTTVYLTIEFNQDAVEKLRDISKTYVSSTDTDGNTTTKKIKMTLDGSTIISTYFQEEISTGIIQLSMGTSTNTSEIQSNIQSASNMAVLLNTDPMPLKYTMETNRFVYSDITAETLKIVIIGLCIVALIMAICMVIKFKKNGLMGAIANIGFTAVLLLAVRYGNVEISLAGIFAIAVAVVIEYIITMLILNEYSKKCEKEVLIKNIKQGHIIPDISVFEKQIIYNLRKMETSEIATLPDVTEGLEFAIKKAANSCNNLNDLLNIIKSKRYTSTRIQRILLYALLGITKKDIDISKKTTPYIRVLGLNNRGKFLISEIAKANPKLEIITSVKRFYDNNTNKNLKLMLDKDIFATNVYTIGYEDDSWSNLDFTQKIINID